MQISTIGLDIAKNVFEVHGIDAAEKVVVRKPAPTAPGAGVFQSGAARLSAWKRVPRRIIGRAN